MSKRIGYKTEEEAFIKVGKLVDYKYLRTPDEFKILCPLSDNFCLPTCVCYQQPRVEYNIHSHLYEIEGHSYNNKMFGDEIEYEI